MLRHDSIERVTEQFTRMSTGSDRPPGPEFTDPLWSQDRSRPHLDVSALPGGGGSRSSNSLIKHERRSTGGGSSSFAPMDTRNSFSATSTSGGASATIMPPPPPMPMPSGSSTTSSSSPTLKLTTSGATVIAPPPMPGAHRPNLSNALAAVVSKRRSNGRSRSNGTSHSPVRSDVDLTNSAAAAAAAAAASASMPTSRARSGGHSSSVSPARDSSHSPHADADRSGGALAPPGGPPKMDLKLVLPASSAASSSPSHRHMSDQQHAAASAAAHSAMIASNAHRALDQAAGIGGGVPGAVGTDPTVIGPYASASHGFAPTSSTMPGFSPISPGTASSMALSTDGSTFALPHPSAHHHHNHHGGGGNGGNGHAHHHHHQTRARQRSRSQDDIFSNYPGEGLTRPRAASLLIPDLPNTRARGRSRTYPLPVEDEEGSDMLPPDMGGGGMASSPSYRSQHQYNHHQHHHQAMSPSRRRAQAKAHRRAKSGLSLALEKEPQRKLARTQQTHGVQSHLPSFGESSHRSPDSHRASLDSGFSPESANSPLSASRMFLATSSNSPTSSFAANPMGVAPIPGIGGAAELAMRLQRHSSSNQMRMSPGSYNSNGSPRNSGNGTMFGGNFAPPFAAQNSYNGGQTSPRGHNSKPILQLHHPTGGAFFGDDDVLHSNSPQAIAAALQHVQQPSFSSGQISPTGSMLSSSSRLSRSPRSTSPPLASMSPQHTSGIIGKKRNFRRTGGVVCANCHKSKTKCTGGRPCERCIRLNREGTCIDRIFRRKGRPKKSEYNPQKAPAGGQAASSNGVAGGEGLGGSLALDGANTMGGGAPSQAQALPELVARFLALHRDVLRTETSYLDFVDSLIHNRLGQYRDQLECLLPQRTNSKEFKFSYRLRAPASGSASASSHRRSPSPKAASSGNSSASSGSGGSSGDGTLMLTRLEPASKQLERVPQRSPIDQVPMAVFELELVPKARAPGDSRNIDNYEFVLFFNERFSELFGYTPQEALTKFSCDSIPWLLGLIHESDWQNHLAFMRDFLQGTRDQFTVTCRCIMKNGKSRRCLIAYQFFRDETGSRFRMGSIACVALDDSSSKVSSGLRVLNRRRPGPRSPHTSGGAGSPPGM